MSLHYDHIHRTASDAGFTLCGIARSRRLSGLSGPLDRWLAKGMNSGMAYLERNRDERLDPARLMEGAETVVVCAVNYKNTAWDQTIRGVAPKIASYAYSADYHAIVKRMLGTMLDRIREEYPGVTGRCFCDTAPILEKAWAAEAGLGWIGKNSLLITPRYGSFVVLGEIVLDDGCDRYDSPYEGDGCGECTACLDGCPNNAIAEPYVIDTGRCVSRLTIEKMPDGAAVRKSMLQGWLFGCDECQSRCPHNHGTPSFSHPGFRPVIDPLDTDAAFWENLTEEEFGRVFSQTPLTRSGFAAIKSRIP